MFAGTELKPDEQTEKKFHEEDFNGPMTMIIILNEGQGQGQTIPSIKYDITVRQIDCGFDPLPNYIGENDFPVLVDSEGLRSDIPEYEIDLRPEFGCNRVYKTQVCKSFCSKLN